MAYNRAQLRTDIYASLEWQPDTRLALVDRVLNFVFDKEWRRILNANSMYRFIKRTPTTDANGRVALSGLTTTVADDHKRFFRVVAITKDDALYDSVDFVDIPLAEDLDFQQRVWYQEGTNIFILPKEASTQFNVYINYLPTRPRDLSSDAVVVDFPDGYEDVLIWESAARLDPAMAGYFKMLAEEARAELLQNVFRLSTKPEKMKYDDSREAWGG